jgi:hypothetical protein
MKRLTMGTLLVAVLLASLSFPRGTIGWTQPLPAPQTVFPSDGEDPRQAGGAELLEAVCPGRVASGKETRCRIACPEFTSLPNDHLTWELARVTRGHFLSPASDDAVLWMVGCEPHSENFGGTILLTRHSQRWKMLWYKAGVPTEECHKVAVRNGREILVCMGRYGGQGNIWTALYVEDLLAPTTSLMAGDEHFFQVFDNTLTCGWNLDNGPNSLTRADIEKVEFESSKRSGRPAISVTAYIGTRPMTPADAKACIAEQNPTKPHPSLSFLPRTKSYRIDFEFDGRIYTPTPSGAAAAQVFAIP